MAKIQTIKKNLEFGIGKLYHLIYFFIIKFKIMIIIAKVKIEEQNERVRIQ